MSRSSVGECRASAWPTFRKARASLSGAACVEVRVLARSVLIRDSKQGALLDQPVIEVSLDSWLQILDEVGRGASRRLNDELQIERADDGSATFSSSATGVRLAYTAAEMIAFEHGVRAGEFSPELVSA